MNHPLISLLYVSRLNLLKESKKSGWHV